MSLRYFPNSFPDYDSNVGVISDNKDDTKKNVLQVIQSCIQNQPPTHKFYDGGVYVGYIGVGYAMIHVANNPIFTLEERKALYSDADRFIMEAVKESSKPKHRRDPGFILGDSGVYVTAALLRKSLGDMNGALEYATQFVHLGGDPSSYSYDELFVGRVGFLCGLKTLQKALERDLVDDNVVFAMCDAIVDSGKRYAVRVRSRSPLMYQYYDTEYLGAAHGLSSILLMLLQFPSYLTARPDAAQLIRASVDFMIASTPPDTANLPTATDELGGGSRRPSEEALVHWCHGAPGVVYTYARAYLVWKDSRYLSECRKCADVVWNKGLLTKGPGICHGIAGNGYVFLLLYRLTGEEVYHYRALKFAAFLSSDLFRQRARVPDAPYSLYEGWAGTACYLADLLHPSGAHFPFFDVFDN